MPNEDTNNVVEEIKQITEVLTDLKNKQTNLINSINALEIRKEDAEKKTIAKEEALQKQDENEVRELTQKINELKSLKTENEVLLSDVQAKLNAKNKELEVACEKIVLAIQDANAILANAESESTKIKEIARENVSKLEKEKAEIESSISSLKAIETKLKEVSIPELETSVDGLKTEKILLITDISSFSRELKSIQEQLSNETQALFAIQSKAETLIKNAKTAEELLAKEGELKASVESLTKEIENLKEDKQAVVITREERIAFEKEKYGVRTKATELDQRIEFIKGVYQDFNLPW